MNTKPRFKLVPTIFLFVVMLLLVSWQYRITCLLLIVLINKKWIRSQDYFDKHVWAYPTLLSIILLSLIICLPNYFQRGRTQLRYLNEEGNPTHTPVLIYAANVIFSEKEIANAGILATAILTSDGMTVAGHKLNGWLLEAAKKDFWTGRFLNFFKSYNRLSAQGSNPGCAAIAQLSNEHFNTGYDPVYITRPRHWNKEKSYPLVVFCHGYLGSWELYQGLLSDLNDCIAVSIGTKDLSGIFKGKDIKSIFTRYIPFLENQGFIIDKTSIHLIGLSNGGSASNSALSTYSNRFKSITFLSTGCSVIRSTPSKVLLIGGAKDPSSSSLPRAKKSLEKVGTKCSLLYMDDADHYLLATHRKELLVFLNEEMGL